MIQSLEVPGFHLVSQNNEFSYSSACTNCEVSYGSIDREGRQRKTREYFMKRKIIIVIKEGKQTTELKYISGLSIEA